MAQAQMIPNNEDYEEMFEDMDAYDRKYAHTAAPVVALERETFDQEPDNTPMVSYFTQEQSSILGPILDDPAPPVAAPVAPPTHPSAAATTEEDPLAALQARLAALK